MQASLELSMVPRLVLRPRSSCLHFLAWIVGLSHHALHLLCLEFRVRHWAPSVYEDTDNENLDRLLDH